jgi:hypothetical protein
MSQRLLSLNEFCSRNHVSRATAYRQFAAGLLSAVKVGTRTCVPVEEEERWRSNLPKYQPGIPPCTPPKAA